MKRTWHNQKLSRKQKKVVATLPKKVLRFIQSMTFINVTRDNRNITDGGVHINAVKVAFNNTMTDEAIAFLISTKRIRNESDRLIANPSNVWRGVFFDDVEWMPEDEAIAHLKKCSIPAIKLNRQEL